MSVAPITATVELEPRKSKSALSLGRFERSGSTMSQHKTGNTQTSGGTK